MKVTAMISVIPIGTELSLSPYVAACDIAERADRLH